MEFLVYCMAGKILACASDKLVSETDIKVELEDDLLHFAFHSTAEIQPYVVQKAETGVRASPELVLCRGWPACGLHGLSRNWPKKPHLQSEFTVSIADSAFLFFLDFFFVVFAFFFPGIMIDSLDLCKLIIFFCILFYFSRFHLLYSNPWKL